MRAAVIIPTLNEAARIGGLLAQLSRLPPETVAEIAVADGGSSDATRALVAEAAGRDPRIRLVDNPARLQAAGVNRAAASLPGDVTAFVRIDAHAAYPDDYVPRVLGVMAMTGVPMVATRLRTVGHTCLQRGIAAASNSRGGNGGSAHRLGGTSGYVDHGHHAGIDRALFERLGGYDESFDTNEDAEFDLRVRHAGGCIWLATEIEADYTPRSTLEALARQYYRYGRGRARTFQKHGERLRLRQLLPPAVVVAVAGSVVLAPLTPVLLLLPLLYLLLIAALTFDLWRRSPSRCTAAAAPAMVAMHLAWGTGFLLQLLRGSNRGTNPPAHALTPQERGA